MIQTKNLHKEEEEEYFTCTYFQCKDEINMRIWMVLPRGFSLYVHGRPDLGLGFGKLN